ncbi:NlpC/P60 family protein [Streptomyces sp. NPDC052077]|uniref:NlpC/P60 family protein n=1 Tax=Streptomyces sp. NPDC052077 TaxID=3154757 RepID=UPI003420D8E3
MPLPQNYSELAALLRAQGLAVTEHPAVVCPRGDGREGYAVAHLEWQPPPLSTQDVPGPPPTLRVSDAAGLLATLTVGARTVTVRGPDRTFSENKRPFHETFDRTTTAGWGLSPAGGTWSHSNGDPADYAVTPGQGLMTMTAANASRHTSLVDTVADLNARLSWSMDRMPTGNAASLALTFGYSSSTSQYRARLTVLTTGALQLALECQTPAGTTALGALTTVGVGYAPGDVWHIRAQRTGAVIRCRAWREGTAEPTTWTHEVTDTTLGAGRIGVRGIASSGNTSTPFTFRVHDLQLDSGTWPDPPVIAQPTRVRLLDKPFTGEWTPALAAQILSWAVATTPDILDRAAAYITGAPPVYDPALGGAQVAGQALYGPTAPDGTRLEGGDFHRYMGLPWTFPNGESQGTAPMWARTLDCSGFLRMLFGWWGGVGMVRHRDFDGLVLPRQAKDLAVSGPGAIIAQATGSPPPLTDLLPGDVLYFNADPADPEIGHCGIYFGGDQHGRPRFISSRKSANGPTFGDLGAASVLTGPGLLYPDSLRMISRL